MDIAQAFGVCELWREDPPEFAEFHNARKPRLCEKPTATDAACRGGLPRSRALLRRYWFLGKGRVVCGFDNEFTVNDLLCSAPAIRMGWLRQEFEELALGATDNATKGPQFVANNLTQVPLSIPYDTALDRP